MLIFGMKWIVWFEENMGVVSIILISVDLVEIMVVLFVVLGECYFEWGMWELVG